MVGASARAVCVEREALCRVNSYLDEHSSNHMPVTSLPQMKHMAILMIFALLAYRLRPATRTTSLPMHGKIQSALDPIRSCTSDHRMTSTEPPTRCMSAGHLYAIGSTLPGSASKDCRPCVCTATGEWRCCTTRPAAHNVARGTARYAETLAFIAAWMHLKLEDVPAGKTFHDNELMQWLMLHGLWFHQVHRSSWLLPWHRQYLYEVERLLVNAWLAIRCDHEKLMRYGWPTTRAPGGGPAKLVAGANHTDPDGVHSFIADPCTICGGAIPYWHHPQDAGRVADRTRIAPYDPYTFGGSGRSSGDECFNASQFGRARYTVGNWGKPQRWLPNGKSHIGYWGSAGRCLRRPFDGRLQAPFLHEGRYDDLLSLCDMPWVDWQALYEKEVHDPAHGFTLGHMQTPISSLDPLFWLHHAGMDRGWTVWQSRCAGPCTSAGSNTTTGAGSGSSGASSSRRSPLRSATKACGSAASPRGYQRRSPRPELWPNSEDPMWATRHPGSHHTVYDDCGPRGCAVAGVHQIVSFSYKMPDCGDDRPESRLDGGASGGDERFDDEGADECTGYSHACTGRLEPFASLPAGARRPASISTAESVLDSERFGHSCVQPAGSSLACDCVLYESPG